MAIFSATLITLSLTLANAQADTSSPKTMILYADVSTGIINELKAASVPKDGIHTWEYSSLSCLTVHLPKTDLDAGVDQEECTFKKTNGYEFRVSNELSSQLISNLVSHQIKPIDGSTSEFKFYSLSEIQCMDGVSAGDTESSCSFSTKPAFGGHSTTEK